MEDRQAHELGGLPRWPRRTAMVYLNSASGILSILRTSIFR